MNLTDSITNNTGSVWASPSNVQINSGYNGSYPCPSDSYFPSRPVLVEPKYPGHQCKTYDEFRTFVRESPDVPQWVKDIVDKLDANDPWMAEMWGGILSRWSQRRVTEINLATARLTSK